ncbi:pyrophosphohydrolase domain-containing protein [Subtercola frigoramans]|uniref:NTP pyrophosphatase (Non-canonical NTP hydrolase) n=1 Tax=Subtercola frigoramans TaxID=120298 RepID=A0ABS2L8H9_9MICO|nr:pyrophosphatase [Subtercola frigoramans]MBM7473408.1 NTP pyrophosphatase (non-canonical NTP hydrolase) [Subtercola frigoramans]
MNLEETGAAVESVSQIYAAKFGIDRTDVWFLLKLQEELGELTQAFVNLKGMSKDRGQTDADKRTAFAHECADVVAHVLLLARNEGVNLEAAIEDKWLRWADSSAVTSAP